MLFRILEDLWADLCFTQRALRRSPAFVLSAVLSLALGIGANTAIFTALDVALWRPLTVADPPALVRFSVSRLNRGDRGSLPTEFTNDVNRSAVFSGTLSFSGDGFTFAADGRAERIQGEVVSPNFFAMLGLEPHLGQGFSADVRAGHWAPEAVLGYRFWMRRFAGDPRVIGTVVHINTYPFTIVGVSAPDFQDLERGYDPDLRMPVLPPGRRLQESQMLSDSGQIRMARLAPGVGMVQAEGAIDAAFQNFLHTAPPTVARQQYGHIRVLPGGNGWTGDVDPFRAPLLVLLALVGVSLLIACANLAGLLLARATAQRRELAVRVSIGAGRLRLVRQMLAESLLIAMLGGALSIPVAKWSAAALFAFLPQGHTPITLDLAIGWRPLLFAFAISLVTGVIFGLAPALQVTRGDLAATLKSDSAGAIGDARTGMRQFLVVAQVAFSMLLLMAAGVFIRTLTTLRPADYQTRADRVLLFTMKPQQEIYTPDRVRALTAELVRRMAEVPGVASAALAENGPLGSRGGGTRVEITGRAPIQAQVDAVSPRFFETVGIPLVAGRDLAASDGPDAPRVAIINQAMARTLFPNQNPLGQHFWRTADRAHPMEIVGIVGDAHYYDVHTAPAPQIWPSIQQDYAYMPTLHVRTNGADIASVVRAVRAQFDAIDPGFPVFNIKTLEMRIQDSLARERMVASLSLAFGALALVLAAIGLYGVLAYMVARRAREIGIRMALGSTAAGVLWLAAREALLLVAAGSVAGAALALAASRLLAQYLFGAAHLDFATVAMAAVVMALVAAIAVSQPAIRACRIDPLSALRHE